MSHRFSLNTSRRSIVGLVFAAAVPWAAAQTPELRVMAHSSFSLPKPLLAQFEKDANIKLSIVKGGDSGEMLNKLILTKAQPIADVVYGLDNNLALKALDNQVLDAQPRWADASNLGLPAQVRAIGVGYVMLNVDTAAWSKTGLKLPSQLDELTTSAYKDLLVVQNPATSSPGLAFFLATISAMGEEKAFDWWAKMRANGLKVAKGWSEAYYTDFSRNGGKRPLVVSYGSSPAAEVFYAKEKITEPPTRALALPGGVFQQVEAVGLVRGGQQSEAALRFVDFLRSAAVQEALQTSMWIQPAVPETKLAEVMRFALVPTRFDNPLPATVNARQRAWIERWTQVVLK